MAKEKEVKWRMAKEKEFSVSKKSIPRCPILRKYFLTLSRLWRKVPLWLACVFSRFNFPQLVFQILKFGEVSVFPCHPPLGVDFCPLWHQFACDLRAVRYSPLSDMNHYVQRCDCDANDASRDYIEESGFITQFQDQIAERCGIEFKSSYKREV